MPTLRTNVLANYAGQAWMGLMGVVFVPLYIRLLGMEAFGLVGLMLSIQALSMMLDLGMGGVLNRELARRAHSVVVARTLADVVRTFEWLVWPIACAVAIVLWIFSDLIADHWLHPQHLTRGETAHAIAIMGLAVALQWPSSFYANGLSGLERQPVLNVINAGSATLRGAGVLGILHWISPTISAFMWWFAAVGACQSLISAVALWRNLPPDSSRTANFRLTELRKSGRLAGGLMLIMILSIAVTQLDRIVLSAMRPLAELGYFSLALSVAAGVGRMIQPMFNAVYPRFSKLVSLGDTKALCDLYHLSNQYLAIVIASTSIVLMIYSHDLIYLWTGDSLIATKVAIPLSILAAGTALNGALNLPYALQLAYGWTRLAIGANFIALVLGIPFSIWAVSNYGMTGAACLWLAINLGSFAIGIPIMHRRLMRGQTRNWYMRDMLPPFIASALVGIISHFLIPTLSRNLLGVFQLLVICGATLIAAALASPAVQPFFKNMWNK